MENKLEQLLNRLIEKGFIPFNIPEITEIKYISTKNKLRITSHQNNRDYKDDFSLRDIVSKSSGLWQFVCENGMRPKRPGYEEHIWQRDGKANGDRCILENEYQYYLIESALCDEDKLEDFILSNIVIKDE